MDPGIDCASGSGFAKMIELGSEFEFTNLKDISLSQDLNLEELPLAEYVADDIFLQLGETCFLFCLVSTTLKRLRTIDALSTQYFINFAPSDWLYSPQVRGEK